MTTDIIAGLLAAGHQLTYAEAPGTGGWFADLRDRSGRCAETGLGPTLGEALTSGEEKPLEEFCPHPSTPDDLRARRREAKRCQRHARRRKAVLDHYGRACACCGITQSLTVDHVNGGGNKHRAQIGEGSYGLYRWLVVNGFPAGFQLVI